MNSTTLYYIHDPMCSWCWGFNHTWNQVKDQIKDQLKIQYVLGGLAPDSNEIMPEEMRSYIQKNWQKIEQTIPGTKFNYDFWKNCTPKRSTYPACRAVIAAKNQGKKFEIPIISSIQTAYYLQAQNPSESSTLIKLATSIGLDSQQFTRDLNSPTTQEKLDSDINLSKSLSVNGFPSLVLERNGVKKLIKIDYNNSDFILKQILT
ncbi:MAG: DsbA family protein [Candidatus Thioglobus sp.]|nr:DsbA family protein [Candidatus Thioglobus pontius]MBL6977162.1 DsbA family protein [Candidatus Thioglobus sp.]MBL6984736.1 DsbA family protein [Candidatus Thioglobus sp.]